MKKQYPTPDPRLARLRIRNYVRAIGERSFTSKDVVVQPLTLKRLADAGLLKHLEKESYHLPEGATTEQESRYRKELVKIREYSRATGQYSFAPMNIGIQGGVLEKMVSNLFAPAAASKKIYPSQRAFLMQRLLILNGMNTIYIDGDGQWIGRRKNWSRQKTAILEALLALESGSASPTCWDEHLEKGFFDTAAIARQIFGDSAFVGGKLKRNKRASLNRSLDDLYLDDIIDKIGDHYRGSGRELYKNNFTLLDLGKKMLASGQNKASSSWLRVHRFYDFRGIKIDRVNVKRAAEGDYVADFE